MPSKDGFTDLNKELSEDEKEKLIEKEEKRVENEKKIEEDKQKYLTGDKRSLMFKGRYMIEYTFDFLLKVIEDMQLACVLKTTLELNRYRI
jgi:hypothetical protein